MSSDSGESDRSKRKVREGEWVYRSVRGKGKIYFIRHVLDRMKQRGISRNEVLTAIKEPTETGLPTAEGRTRVRWYRSHRTAIDVVYEEHDTFFRIITATAIDISTQVDQLGRKQASKRKPRGPRGKGKPK